MPSVRSELLKQLIRAHGAMDDRDFRSAALKLAAAESQAGHTKLGDEIRSALNAIPATTSKSGQRVVDIGRPRKELSGLLQGGYTTEKLKDIILKPATRNRLTRLLKETRKRTDLLSWGVSPTRKLLFYGPPGCGKTLAARVVAGELGLPLMTVRFESLFSRYLGETANHLSLIFAEMPQRPAVYFFDEFDALARTRADAQDIGEIRRVVISFLQMMDSDQSPGLIIAATNFEKALDRAIFRRFDKILEFALPDSEEVAELITLRLAQFELSEDFVDNLAVSLKGTSFADVATVCDEAVKSMVLDGRKSLSEQDLLSAVQERWHLSSPLE